MRHHHPGRWPPTRSWRTPMACGNVCDMQEAFHHHHSKHRALSLNYQQDTHTWDKSNNSSSRITDNPRCSSRAQPRKQQNPNDQAELSSASP